MVGLRDFGIFQTRLTAVDFTSSVVLWITVVLLTKFCVVRTTTEVDFIRSEEIDKIILQLSYVTKTLRQLFVHQ